MLKHNKNNKNNNVNLTPEERKEREELKNYVIINHLKRVEGLDPEQQLKFRKGMTNAEVKAEITRVEALIKQMQENTEKTSTDSDSQKTPDSDTPVENTLEGTDPVNTLTKDEGTTDTIPQKIETPKVETPTSTAPKKLPKKGVIATIINAIVENTGLTKTQILDICAVELPDRKRDSMKNTIQIQVPNRLNNEKNLHVILTEQGYLIDPSWQHAVIKTERGYRIPDNAIAKVVGSPPTDQPDQPVTNESEPVTNESEPVTNEPVELTTTDELVMEKTTESDEEKGNPLTEDYNPANNSPDQMDQLEVVNA